MAVADDEQRDPRVERTRRRALEAVIELLAGEGLDAVTHTRVAEVAGVGRATVYRHWPDAGALLVEALLDTHRVTDALRHEDLQSLDLPDAVGALARRVGQVLRDDPLAPVMLSLVERAQHDATYASIRDQITAFQAQPLERLLAVAVERGVLPDDLDVAHAKAMLVGPLFFAALLLGDPLDEDQVEAHVAAWLRAVRYRAP